MKRIRIIKIKKNIYEGKKINRGMLKPLVLGMLWYIERLIYKKKMEITWKKRRRMVSKLKLASIKRKLKWTNIIKSW